MSVHIESANSLVSRVAQWVGAIPILIDGITATGYNPATGIITTSSDPTALLYEGDFISNSIKNFTAVLSTTSNSITVSDPEGIWTGVTYPVAILKIPTQGSLEIQSCIQLAELKMRVLELPSLRSNPYDTQNPDVLTTDDQGMAPIPADMNWPIFFFQETASPATPNQAAGYGPWIVYDRVGDREIIRRRMIDQLFVRPFGVPRVIRASFSEVGLKYVFTPNPGANVTIKAYYQKTFPFLLSSTSDLLNPIVQTNAALSSFPEGYWYGCLWAYYDKNKNTEEAQKWNDRFEEAYGIIQDQNFKDKWRGGDRHLTSEFQPRTPRFSFK